MASELIDTQNGIAWILASLGILRGDGQRPGDWEFDGVDLLYIWGGYNAWGIVDPIFVPDPMYPDDYHDVFYPNKNSILNKYFMSMYNYPNKIHKAPQTFSYHFGTGEQPGVPRSIFTHSIDVKEQSISVETVMDDYGEGCFLHGDHPQAGTNLLIGFPAGSKGKIRVYRRVDVYSRIDFYTEKEFPGSKYPYVSSYTDEQGYKFSTAGSAVTIFGKDPNRESYASKHFNLLENVNAVQNYVTIDNYQNLTGSIDDGMYGTHAIYDVARSIVSAEGMYAFSFYESVDVTYDIPDDIDWEEFWGKDLYSGIICTITSRFVPTIIPQYFDGTIYQNYRYQINNGDTWFKVTYHFDHLLY